MDKIIIHSVPGLPEEVYQVNENRIHQFFPMIHQRHMVNIDGSIASFKTLEDACNCLIEFVGRMQ